MPRLDGTGPLGQGPMTGRGLGNCNGNTSNAFRKSIGAGGFRRGLAQKFGRWFRRGRRFGKRFGW